MAIEFRSALFGFNRDDVFDFVHKKDADMKIMQSSFNDKIKRLEEEIENLKVDLDNAQKANIDLSLENSRISSELSQFQQKTEEIESLSRKIGKLYLISKSSAKSIVDRAEENAEIINSEADARLLNIEQTEAALHDITKSIVSASEKFVTDINSLENDLRDAKLKVQGNKKEQIRISEEFSEIYEKLS